MKKYLLIAVIMISGISFGQNSQPVLEAEGQLVKATYYYDNGKVQQVGYFKDGKLDGKWTSYDVKGNVKAVAEYTNGVKSGNWTYFSSTPNTTEVAFSDNKVTSVKHAAQNAVAKN